MAMITDKKIAAAEAKLIDIERRRRLLDSFERRVKRQLRSLRGAQTRAAARGPAEEPCKVMSTSDAVAAGPPPETLLRAAQLAEMQELAERFAAKLGVAKPSVRWATDSGACRRVQRAHIHTRAERRRVMKVRRDGYRTWKRKRTIPRGRICVSPRYYDGWIVTGLQGGVAELMAHEVAHLRRSGKRPQRGHGQRFEAIVRWLLGEEAA